MNAQSHSERKVRPRDGQRGRPHVERRMGEKVEHCLKDLSKLSRLPEGRGCDQDRIDMEKGLERSAEENKAPQHENKASASRIQDPYKADMAKGREVRGTRQRHGDRPSWTVKQRGRPSSSDECKIGGE